MEVIVLKHLSHLPQDKPYLMVGMVASEEDARAEMRKLRRGDGLLLAKDTISLPIYSEGV
jgi:hypothetical protein